MFTDAVSSVVAALKGSPGLLAVVLLQLVLLGVLYVVTQANAERQQARELYLLEKCFDGRGEPP